MMSSPHPLSLLGVAVSSTFYAGRLSFLPFNTEGVRNEVSNHFGPENSLFHNHAFNEKEYLYPECFYELCKCISW